MRRLAHHYFLQIIIKFAILLLCQVSTIHAESSTNPWELPIIRPNFQELIHSPEAKAKYAYPSDGKFIPKNMWVTFRDIPPEEHMYSHLKNIFSSVNQSGWKIHLFNDSSCDVFMETYYKDTSIYWAYQMIHDKRRVAVSDIWRYAALYAFGGFYLDDDAYVAPPIDRVIGPTDKIILSVEGNKHEDCYHPSYRLSSVALTAKYSAENMTSIFNGARLVQWGFFVMPGHPLFYELMKNVVEIFKLEYMKESVIMNNSTLVKFKAYAVICATGSEIMTSTFLSTILQMRATNASQVADLGMRMAGKDFSDYGGTYKVWGFKPYNPHGKHDPHYSLFEHSLLKNYHGAAATRK